jgi:hypothetical protein
LALNPTFLKSLFVYQNQTTNQYKFNFYVAGNTYPIYVDDIVPMYKPVVDQSYFIMADAINNTFWGPLLEKAYAKFTGSYEHIALGGIASEAMRAVA